MAEWTLDSGQQAPADAAPLTASEAARLCSVHHRTIRRAILRGDLNAAKVTGAYQIDPADLRAWQISHRFGSRWQPRIVHSNPESRVSQSGREPMTSFIGREAQIAEVHRLLCREDVRLLTLTGPGGVGKTRLAHQVMTRLRAEDLFADGLWFIELAPLDQPEQVIPSIARAIDILSGGKQPVDALVTYFANRNALLVIDNFEHVMDAAPELALLLTSTRFLKVLLTSRAIVRISGEHAFPVPPLNLPDWKRDSSLIGIHESESVSLFVERAQRINPTYHLTSENAATVAQICHRLDGLPLAIELAAARSNFLSPTALLARLDDPFLLTGGSRDAPERLRTMRAAIGWSYRLLRSEEQSLLRRMAVFAGGASVEAIEAACYPGNAAPKDLLELLANLADSSLVQMEDRSSNETRFTMLESVRAFGLRELVSNDEEQLVRDAHAAHFLALAERVALGVELRGLKSHSVVSTLEREQPNIWLALRWYESQNDAMSLRRLALAMQDFWVLSGDWAEGVYWLERAFECDEPHSPSRIWAMGSMGMMLTTMGDHARAETVLFEALQHARELDALKLVADTLGRISWLRCRQGRFAEAAESGDQMLAIGKQLNDLRCQVSAFHWLGIAAMGQKDRAAAKRLFQSEDEVLMQCSRTSELASRQLAMFDAEDGNFALASARMRQIIETEPLTNRTLAILVDDFASLAMMLGFPERAARLFGACQQITESIGLDKFWVDPDRILASQAQAEQSLGSEAFRSEWANGKLLSRLEMVREIEDVLHDGLLAGNVRDRCKTDSRHALKLTARELEVLRLLAQRYSNPEIADRLFVSTRTVQTHVSHIFQKLGVDNRRDVIDAARAAGLT